MGKKIPTSGNQEFELVSPVKILVKPGFSGDGETSSLRRRSFTQIEIDSPQSIERPGRGGESSNIFVLSDKFNGPTAKLNEDALLQSEDDVCEKKKVAYYLQHCFRLMYLTGMSTYDPATASKEGGEEETWMDFIVKYLQKIAFWAVALTTLVYSFFSLKLHWVAFLSDRGVFFFVYFGKWLFTFVAEIYLIYLLAFRHKFIKDKMATLEKIGTNTIGEVGTKKWKCNNPHKLITVLFVTSMFACFMGPMGGNGVQEWSPKKLILDSSHKLSIRLFIWSPKDFDVNSTKFEKLEQEYGTELTPLTFVMGIAEIGIRFWSNMKMDAVQNLGVVVAVLTWLRNRYFSGKVKNIDIENYSNGYDTDELDSPTGFYAEFKHAVRKENRLMNGLMGGLLNIMHVHNLMQCAIFLMRCMDNKASLTEIVFLLYGLIKVVVIYYFGKKAEAENEVYEQWIRDWAMVSRDPIFLGRVPAILDEMTKKPLGVGRGSFLVGHGFISRFFGLVGSMFMLEVDDDYDE